MTTPNGPGGFGDSTAGDPLPEATTLVRGATDAGHQLKILGGLGVRVLCPDFPPRLRAGQDIDLACLGKNRRKIADYLERYVLPDCRVDKPEFEVLAHAVARLRRAGGGPLRVADLDADALAPE